MAELGEELLTVWFLAFLAVAWIIVYLPSVWRARQKSPLPAVQRFKRRMRLISPRTYTGRWIVIPESRERLAHQAALRAQDRRKQVLRVLIGVAAGTGIWAILSGGPAVEAHLVADAAVAFYVALLLDAKRKRDERLSKVHAIGGRTPLQVEADGAYEVLEAGGGSRP